MSEPGDSSPSPLPADVTTEPEPPPRLAVDIVREDGDWSAFGAVEEAGFFKRLWHALLMWWDSV